MGVGQISGVLRVLETVLPHRATALKQGSSEEHSCISGRSCDQQGKGEEGLRKLELRRPLKWKMSGREKARV